MTALTCASDSLCVAGDFNGHIAGTTEPGAAAPAWHVTTIESHAWVFGISCPSTTLCVAVSGAFSQGDVEVSHQPGGPDPAWTASRAIDDARLLDVSCPSTALCVAVDAKGRVLSSTDPGASPAHWSAPRTVDPYALVSISCPAVSLCVADDTGGFSVRSTEPADVRGAWSAREPTGMTVGPSGGVGGSTDVDCPTTRFCIDAGGVYHAGIAVSTSQASPTPSWAPSLYTDGWALPQAVTCASEAFCVVLAGNGVLTSIAPASSIPGWSAPYTIDQLPYGVASVARAPVVKGRSVTFGLGCDSQLGAEVCAAKAVLTASVTVRVGRHRRRVRRTVVLARASDATPWATTPRVVPVTLILNAAGRRLLARAGRMRATLAIEAFTAEHRVPARKAGIGVFSVSFGHGRARR